MTMTLLEFARLNQIRPVFHRNPDGCCISGLREGFAEVTQSIAENFLKAVSLTDWQAKEVTRDNGLQTIWFELSRRPSIMDRFKRDLENTHA